MKMQFSFVIQGSSDLEKRFIDKMNEEPLAQMNIIHGFGNLIALALNAKQEDNLCLVGFNAGKIAEDGPQQNESGQNPESPEQKTA